MADVKILLLLTCYVCSFLLFSCSSWGHCDCDCLRGGGFTFNRQVLSRSSLVNVIFQLSGVGARHFSLTPYVESECDVPVPGIPVPGNSSFFLMVSEPESKKFGTEKESRNRNRKNLVPKKSLGTGLEKFWYRKKSRNRSRKSLVSKKKYRNQSRNFSEYLC